MVRTSDSKSENQGSIPCRGVFILQKKYNPNFKYAFSQSKLSYNNAKYRRLMKPNKLMIEINLGKVNYNQNVSYLIIVKKNVANRIRTCAGYPNRFLVCRLNHSAIATLLTNVSPPFIYYFLTTETIKRRSISDWKILYIHHYYKQSSHF